MKSQDRRNPAPELPLKAQARLEQLRRDIDTADRKMMQALVRRFKIVEKIGKLKKQYGLPVIQVSRMNEMLEGRKEDSVRLNLDPKLIYNIFDLLHDASIRAQKTIQATRQSKKKASSAIRKRKKSR